MRIGPSSITRCSGRLAQRFRLRPPCAELEASGRGVCEGMIEDFERRLMLTEDELEVVVARGIGDGDRHQIRRSTPEQSHRDAVALARHQFCPPGFVGWLKHGAVLSLVVVTRRSVRRSAWL